MKIRMKSVTYALKLKDILQKNGIRAGVVRDSQSAGNGCVYAVSFDEIYKHSVYSLIAENKILLHPEEKRNADFDDLF